MQPMQSLPWRFLPPVPKGEFFPMYSLFTDLIQRGSSILIYPIYTERALYLIHCSNEIHYYYHCHHSLHCSLCTRKSGCFGWKCTYFVPGFYRRVLWGGQWEMQGKPLPEYFIFWLTYVIYVYKEKKKSAVLFPRSAPVSIVAIYSLLLSPLPTDTWLIFEPSPTSPFTRSIRKWRFAAKFPLSFVRPWVCLDPR